MHLHSTTRMFCMKIHWQSKLFVVVFQLTVNLNVLHQAHWRPRPPKENDSKTNLFIQDAKEGIKLLVKRGIVLQAMQEEDWTLLKENLGVEDFPDLPPYQGSQREKMDKFIKKFIEEQIENITKQDVANGAGQASGGAGVGGVRAKEQGKENDKTESKPVKTPKQVKEQKGTTRRNVESDEEDTATGGVKDMKEIEDVPHGAAQSSGGAGVEGAKVKEQGKEKDKKETKPMKTPKKAREQKGTTGKDFESHEEGKATGGIRI